MAREGPYRSIETYGEWSHCGWEPQPQFGNPVFDLATRCYQ